MRLTWAPGSCSTCRPSGSHPFPSRGPLDFESRVRGYAGCADSAPAKGRRGIPWSARHAESRLRAGRRRPFGTRSCGLGASLLGGPAAPPARASQLTPSGALGPALLARRPLLRPAHRGAGLGLSLQASAGLRNACRPVSSLTLLTCLLATSYTVPVFRFN